MREGFLKVRHQAVELLPEIAREVKQMSLEEASERPVCLRSPSPRQVVHHSLLFYLSLPLVASILPS